MANHFCEIYRKIFVVFSFGDTLVVTDSLHLSGNFHTAFIFRIILVVTIFLDWIYGIVLSGSHNPEMMPTVKLWLRLLAVALKLYCGILLE